MIEKQAVFTMTVTPFKENGDLDEAGFKRQLHFQADGGVGVFVLSYGSGEGLQVTHRERLHIYSIAAKELRGKVPVYAAGQGLGPSTAEFIEQCREIAATGIEAIQLHQPRPAYPGATAKPAEVERYHRDVLDAVRHPFFMSIHNGAAPGIEPNPTFLRQLIDTYPHLIGFNLVANQGYVRRVIDAMKGSSASVRTGGPAMFMETLTFGGHGVLLFEPNLLPKYCASIAADWQGGKANRAAEKWATMLRLTEVLGRYRNPVSIKTAMNMLGLPGGYVRRPYLELDEAAKADIAATMERLNVKAWEASV